MMTSRPLCLRLAALAPSCVIALLAACSDSEAGAHSSSQAGSDAPAIASEQDEQAPRAEVASATQDPETASEDRWSGLQDASASPAHLELLDLVFDSALGMPTNPFIKTRSKLQLEVVNACLELGLYARAQGYIDTIENWRRGEGYANLAFALAEAGQGHLVEPYLEQAIEVSDWGEEILRQAWRRDRIRSAVARTLLVLGRIEEAYEIQSNLVDEESGRIAPLTARLAEPEHFDQQFEQFHSVAELGSFEQIKSALEGLVVLYGRNYEDEERRSAVRDSVQWHRGRIPAAIHIDLLLSMSQAASDHGDSATAQELVDEACAVVDEAVWTAEHHVPMLAKIASQRFLAGDEVRARAEATAALAIFDAGREEVVDMFRSESLLPLAEAWQGMGEGTSARAVYARCLTEAGINVNSRPRLEDLIGIVCSIVTRGVEVDEPLKQRIESLNDALSEAW